MAPRDPDPNGERKDKAERRVARALARYFREQREKLDDMIGRQMGIPLQPGDMFWDSEKERLRKILKLLLQDMADESTSLELDQIFRRKQGDIDPAQLTEEAIEWAISRAAELSSVITSTTRGGIEGALQKFFEIEGFTVGDVIDDIDKLVNNPVRSQAIAVTETTRAYARGQEITTAAIENVGLEVVRIWNTNNDGLVCPICAPRHRKEIESGWEFPAHVNCRCWPTSRLRS